ncbi:MAG TPA: hypothetical protein PLZ77_03220 [Lachnospiraceae bacterium]|nr:hypothetical protein [Lachnospiraceae bacterium]HPF29100.1 hypothetical protein [Lachnospiraceae bacterium]
MFQHKKRFLWLPLSLMLLLSACGNKSDLEVYQDSMNKIYQEIITTSTSINGIDATSADAVDTLLAELDTMNASFQTLAAIEVPEEFSSCESLADDAATYMSESVDLYHQAFADGNYQADLGSQAKSKYETAMLHIKYIGDLLMGNVPEGDGVTVSYN